MFRKPTEFFRQNSRLRWNRILVVGIFALAAIPVLWVTAKLEKTHYSSYWVPAYTKDLVAGRYHDNDRTKHFIFLFCDHWEPGGGPRGLAKASAWLDDFEDVASRHMDSQGRNFQYSWFYPIDNFDPLVLDRLNETVHKGLGEIEVHWHHHHTDSGVFEQDLRKALEGFTRVGALISEPGGKPRYSFIHGNWTLDNSGAARFCGIDDEISILRKTGCYADLTFPALGTAAQPSTINRIFYTLDTPAPKSYEENHVLAKSGTRGQGLMMIPGPLGLDFRNPLILIEYGCLDDAEGSGLTGVLRKPKSYRDYFKAHRVDLWNRIGVGVEGRPDWVFVKIHAHGIQHREFLMGGELDEMLGRVEDYCRKRDIKLHYVTAREAYNLVRALEEDVEGPPQEYYDFVVPPPLNRTEAAD